MKDPVKFHAPAPFQHGRGRDHPAQDVVEQGLHRRRQRGALRGDAAATRRSPSLTAAMCEGNKLQKIRDDVPRPVLRRRASARATPSPSPPAWPRPAPGRSSTSTARSSSGRTTRSSRRSRSRTCRSSSRLDRAGLVGADGPTHHGTYDLAYMRVFPNMVVMAPGDEKDVAPMLDFALGHDVAGRRSATPGPASRRSTARSSRSSWARPRSSSGRPTACSWPAARSSAPASAPPSGSASEHGLRVGVVNARFVKPLDRATVLKAIEECGFVLTVEEGCLMGGFGSAVLEAANDAGLCHGPRPPPRPARPLRPPRRARRAARRGRPRRRRHRPRRPRAGPGRRPALARADPEPTPTTAAAMAPRTEPASAVRRPRADRPGRSSRRCQTAPFRVSMEQARSLVPRTVTRLRAATRWSRPPSRPARATASAAADASWATARRTRSTPRPSGWPRPWPARRASCWRASTSRPIPTCRSCRPTSPWCSAATAPCCTPPGGWGTTRPPCWGSTSAGSASSPT